AVSTPRSLRRPTTSAGSPTAPPTAQSLRCAPTGDRCGSLQDDFGSRAHEARQPGGVPIGEANAAMRLGLADRRRLRRAVQPEMFLVDIDPDDADRVVRAGGNFRLRLGRVG